MLHILFFAFLLILIETYWNVNQYPASPQLLQCIILIETYWNVNTNRIMVQVDVERILIETYWNVNRFAPA